MAPLRFDFAIFDKNDKIMCLIEYQGEQHTNKSNGFYSENIVKHDKMKKEYCDKHNLKLIYINYKRNYNLTWEDLQLNELEELNGI